VKKKKLDLLDLDILTLLKENSKISFRELAKQLNVATQTVQTRIQHMQNDGVIKGNYISLDYEKLGYGLTVVTEVTVSKGKLDITEREIAKISEACAVYDTTGLTDAIVIAKFKNREDLGVFTKKLLAMPYVERTNTHVVLAIHKENFNLPLQIEVQED
jgi:DNA-binding Lrp family transcriptional regulator|tara:strand:+ start:542 stop:1018 length:477 start_codon:yes stop_codon:yes gene_type:complete